ncbi:MAG: ATP-grasp domain-containing protein [Acetatifactor sp.]|nr:ATP-grasp domain-containing protein [Acetatifactor sp.]
MNILILSCGTRCKLVEYFKKSNEYKKVVCTDISEQAPALLMADASYLVPKMTDYNYLDVILEICEKEKIKVLLPLHEDELLLIAKNKQIFIERNILPIISDYSNVALCKDKYSLSRKLNEKNILAVDSYTVEEYLKKENDVNSFYVKPRYGAGSVNTFKVHSKQMLKAIAEEYSDEFIVQPGIEGKEYGVDIYVDMISRNVVSVFCKEKLRMRAGETEKSLSIKDEKIEALVIKAVKEMNLIGPIDVDVLEENGRYYILEINPRFGGGYPHAYECGIDFMKFIAKNANGEVNTFSNDYAEGVIAMKYSEIVIKNLG